jgi:hypothetical protein
MQGGSSARSAQEVPPEGATATFRTGGAPTRGRKVIERLEAIADPFEKVAHPVQSIAVKES